MKRDWRATAINCGIGLAVIAASPVLFLVALIDDPNAFAKAPRRPRRYRPAMRMLPEYGQPLWVQKSTSRNIRAAA